MTDTLRFAQVVAVHPQRRTVDLAVCDSGLPVAEAQVAAGAVSSDSGVWDVPDVSPPQSQAAAGGLAQGGRSLIAVVAFAGRRPLVIGFVHPADGQLVFSQANRQITRHPSGAYTTVAPDGSIEVFHPSGAYLRIGTGAHEDLAPLAVGAPWQTPAAPAAQITLATSGFTLTILPGGNTTLTSGGNLTATIAGNLTATAAGTVDVQATGSLTCQSGGDMTFNSGGALNFIGAKATNITSTGAFAIVAPSIDLNN